MVVTEKEKVYKRIYKGRVVTEYTRVMVVAEYTRVRVVTEYIHT